MKPENFKEGIVKLCKRIGRRNFVIIGAVFLIAVAVTVNLVMYSSNNDGNFDYSQSAGMDGSENQNSDKDSGNKPTESVSDSYFSSVQVNRQRSRDEAIEVLQSVVDNEGATETAKNEALAEINKLALVMETEANIESLIVAKGFEECVAVISGESASIVVKSEGLIPAQISQINEIVFEQAGIDPVNIKIIER